MKKRYFKRYSDQIVERTGNDKNFTITTYYNTLYLFIGKVIFPPLKNHQHTIFRTFKPIFFKYFLINIRELISNPCAQVTL
jgi:hypothetical protein